MAEVDDFWASSGYHLLERDGNGRLVVTDEYLRAFYRRPEMTPIEESCAAECALHAALMAEPRLIVAAQQLAAIADSDARENYEVMLAFRDLLLSHETLEACYLWVFRSGQVRVPPLFLEQLAHVILRGILDGCTDPIRLRAAELLFRAQRVTLQDSAVMLADEEVVDMYAATGGFGSLGQLLSEANTAMRQVDLDVLSAENGEIYWQRSDRFDLVLDLSFTRPGLDALCRVLELWIGHFLGAEVAITPVQQISDERWVWHVGLDAESTEILNALYAEEEVSDDAMEQLLSLFRLEFRDASSVLPRVAGRPVYLGLAMDGDQVLRLKPQNLLVNLPLADAA